MVNAGHRIMCLRVEFVLDIGVRCNIMEPMRIGLKQTRNPRFDPHRQTTWQTGLDLAVIVGILLASSMIGLLFFSLGFSDANIITIFILGVLLTAVFTSRPIYGAFTSLFSVLLFNYLFTTPRFTLHAYNPEYPLTFFIMFAASLITSSLTTKIKAQAEQQAQRARLTEILLETSQMLQQAETREEIMAHTGKQMVRMLGRPILFFPVADMTPVLLPPIRHDVADQGEALPARSRGNTKCKGEENTDARMVKGAQEFFERLGSEDLRMMAGQHPSGLYLAVRSNQRIIAIVFVHYWKERPLDAIEKNLSVSLLGECALALEKHEATMTRNRAELEVRQEQLRANLLRTISHDLRTPLTSISGNASLLLETGGQLTATQTRELVTDIRDDAEWLNGIVENLLAVSRVENGSLGLKREPELLEEVIGEACRRFSRRALSSRLSVQVEDDLLMAWMDSRLIVQVLNNLLDNVEKYVPGQSPVIITARRHDDMAEICIADQGPGIPDESKSRVFDMFFRLEKSHADDRRGMGLGLYLCRMIMQAHGGHIRVEDNLPHGAVFCLTLPLKEMEDEQAENVAG